jgi:redox-sensitive bicupin YhaK (pirin superfamily)
MESSPSAPQLCGMGQMTLYPSSSRGHADHGWLQSRHSFSFASYFDPQRIRFGALRVLNDDRVAPGMGFGEHPHDNMEIISIPLSGALEHRDSMGNRTVIRHGDIQVMSAGTGVQHSEYNHSRTEPVEFLQIWVFPDTRNVPPRYDQVTLDEQDRRNRLQQILSPDPDAEGVWIHQSAWFQLGSFDKGVETTYALRQTNNGVYAFVIRGDFDLDDTRLSERDGAGITETETIRLKSLSDDAEILLMEVPML